MGNDAKAIIGSVIGTGLVAAGLLSAQVASLNTRIDDMRAEMRDIRAEMERFDARLRAVEVALGKIDQRLLTIERVVLPPAAPGEQGSIGPGVGQPGRSCIDVGVTVGEMLEPPVHPGVLLRAGANVVFHGPHQPCRIRGRIVARHVPHRGIDGRHVAASVV